MKDKFITDSGVEIPLWHLAFTYVEENPRFKDTFWTNYTLPIDLRYTRDFLSQLGQYSSLNNLGLKRYHEGIHQFEGKLRRGKVEIVEFDRERIKIQIDSGFETLPNFETPLSELPLLDIEVPDIYTHANEIVTKKYPEVVYNFPKLYTDEYDLESEAYKYFDSFINNRNRQEGRVEKEFPRNRVENDMDVYNKNIIHPLPYLLYVLKVGFKDAGFNLEGDILEDEHLKQRCIWSGKHYYYDGEQKEHKLSIFSQEVVDYTPVGNIYNGRWEKRIVINAPGKYHLQVHCQSKQTVPGPGGGTLDFDSGGAVGLSIPSRNINIVTSVDENRDYDYEFSLSEEDTKAGFEIYLHYEGAIGTEKKDTDGRNLGIAQIKILPIRQHSKSGSPIPYIFNENKVNLKKAVPEMTFGELVTTIKNLRNYDLEFEGNRAIMNRIRIDKTREPEDFRMFEVENPVRRFSDKTFFNITFPESEYIETQNIFFNEQGYHLNYKSVPDTATEISINVMCLPMMVFRAVYTARALDSNALMLVYYAGLDHNGDNHAQDPEGLMGEALAQYLEPWFMNRLVNFNYKWTFVCEKNKIRKFNIRSEIFAYNKKHWIKSWVKKSLSENFYSVEIETETF